jgi:TonB family protein
MISGFVLAWIVSVIATVPANQKVFVAQQSPGSSKVATPSRAEDLPPAALQGAATAVRGGVVRGIENGVAGGIAGGVKAESSKETHRSLAMNQNPASPAQRAGSAKLFGTVSDASQARVPNATIVVSNKEGGIKEITSSSAAGEFEFRTLPLGRYSVEVRTAGFRPFQQTLELHANEPRELDVVLEVGEVAETVNVVAKAPPASLPDTRSGPPRRIRVGGNVQATKLIQQVQPIYPEQAQVRGIQGTVLIEAVIFKDGSIGTMRVLNKLADPELVDAAVEAVKNWRYEPTLLNGQPIEIVTTITVNFRLSSS